MPSRLPDLTVGLFHRPLLLVLPNPQGFGLYAVFAGLYATLGEAATAVGKRDLASLAASIGAIILSPYTQGKVVVEGGGVLVARRLGAPSFRYFEVPVNNAFFDGGMNLGAVPGFVRYVQGLTISTHNYAPVVAYIKDTAKALLVGNRKLMVVDTMWVTLAPARPHAPAMLSPLSHPRGFNA